jgi:PAS domain S-box-containing protein
VRRARPRKYDPLGALSFFRSLLRRRRPERESEDVPGPVKEANKTLADALLRAPDVHAAGLLLVQEVVARLDVDLAAVALVSDDRRRASGLVALQDGVEADWWLDTMIDLEREASGIAAAAFEGSPIVVYDVAASAKVSRRLAERVGAQSAVFVPLISSGRVQAVLVAATTKTRRLFGKDELAALEAMAADAALAVERAQSSTSLADALERERIVGEIARKVRSELDLDAVLRVAVEETARATGASRAFIRLGEPGEAMPVVAEWDAPGSAPVGSEAARLPVLNLAARELHTEAVDDIEDAPELLDPTLGSLDSLRKLGARAVLATPILAFDQVIGVFGLHRSDPHHWTAAERTLLESVSSEAGLAIHTARLLEESGRQARIQRGFYGIASALAEPLSLDETWAALAKAADEALGGSFAALLLPSTDGLALAAGHELPGPMAELLRDGLPESAAALVLCAQERRTLAAPDVREDDRFAARWRELAREAGYHSLLAIPIEAPRRDEGGLVLVFFAEPRAFTDDELELAQHFAGAARGALERSELFETERSSRALSQQLARMGGRLATELDPGAILGEVVEQAPTLLGADACSVRRLDEDRLVVSAASGEGAEEAIGSESPATAWLVGEIVQSRGPTAVADVAGDSRLLDADPILAEGYSSYLGVPLFGAEGELYGVLAVYGRRPRPWLEEEIEALAALAGNASAVLANADLYQKVKDEQDRSSAILANIADGIVAVDREGTAVLWNAAAERITGVPAGEALGRTPAQVLQRTLESGEAGAVRDRLVPIHRGGEEVWLSVSEAVMRDPAGAVAGRIYAFRDVSSERVVEEMKTEFVAAVSHSLRTPLTSIYGFAETLLRQDVLFEEDERRTFLTYIASEAQRLTGIVDALLNVARLDAGDLQMQLAPTDVGAVVSEVVRGVQESRPLNGRRLVVDLPTEPLDAAADRDKLRQVLANLLDNAVKFSPDGGTVTVAARRKGGTVEIRVVDRGPGIPAAEQVRIFSKFYRGDLARDRPVGTGLGLFIAGELVRAMGGRIWVDSEEGEGASFAFELPLAGEPLEVGV